LFVMEKDIDRIPKNADTDIVIRVDDFGGRRGITIREFVKSERYTGFTKAGTRIPAEHFKAFKQAINSIDEKELLEAVQSDSQSALNGGAKSPGHKTKETKSSGKKESDKISESEEDIEEQEI